MDPAFLTIDSDCIKLPELTKSQEEFGCFSESSSVRTIATRSQLEEKSKKITCVMLINLQKSRLSKTGDGQEEEQEQKEVDRAVVYEPRMLRRVEQTENDSGRDPFKSSVVKVFGSKSIAMAATAESTLSLWWMSVQGELMTWTRWNTWSDLDSSFSCTVWMRWKHWNKRM